MSPRPPKVITIDFETKPIADRPRYPPVPSGFSIKRPGERKSTYHAWTHPTENNCTIDQARRVLADAWASSTPLLFQNAKFDVDVAQTHMGMGDISWDRIHDTLYLLFLDNPHAASHSLKPSALRILGMLPEEQDAVRDWLIAHQDDLRAEGLLPADAKKITGKNFGAWISLAPGKLVGAYADGDVIRTEKLFNKLWPEICDRGMRAAYDRERELMPILLRNEREGVRFDAKRAQADVKALRSSLEVTDAWLRKVLKSKELNIDSDQELADALVAARKADEALFNLTPKGVRSVAKDSLIQAVTDKRVLSALQYRSKLSTFVGTFMEPWLAQAQAGKAGLIYPNWNQVKQYGNSGDAGARTGRMSASRFMNTPKEVAEYNHPTHIPGTAPIPFVREYVLPDKGQLWGKRDYSQQEFRILAHYEDGNLLEKFQANPDMDVHVLVSELISRSRGTAKTIGFGLLYGMGIGKLAERLGVPVEDAKVLKKEYMGILPGLKSLQDELTARGKGGDAIVTWGGRQYFVEEPKEVDGRMRTFEYKLLNYLIQGSAADCTKQAIINYDGVRKDGRFLITVHDEINISCSKGAMKSEMKLLREAMAATGVDTAGVASMPNAFDVPMFSDGKTGLNWGNLTKFKEA